VNFSSKKEKIVEFTLEKQNFPKCFWLEKKQDLSEKKNTGNKQLNIV